MREKYGEKTVSFQQTLCDPGRLRRLCIQLRRKEENRLGPATARITAIRTPALLWVNNQLLHSDEKSSNGICSLFHVGKDLLMLSQRQRKLFDDEPGDLFT